jgi:hypothetical protein
MMMMRRCAARIWCPSPRYLQTDTTWCCIQTRALLLTFGIEDRASLFLSGVDLMERPVRGAGGVGRLPFSVPPARQPTPKVGYGLCVCRSYNTKSVGVQK